MLAKPYALVLAASTVLGVSAAAVAQPVAEFRLRPDGSTMLSPTSPTLRVVFEARVNNWGEGSTFYTPPPHGTPIVTPVGTGPGVPGQIGWLLAALLVDTNEAAVPGRLLRKGTLRASEYSRSQFPGDSRLTSDPEWQQENSNSTRFGWTYALRNGVNALGEDFPSNGLPFVRNGFLALAGGLSPQNNPDTPVSGLNISPGAEYQGTMIGLSPSPTGAGAFVPLYVMEYSTSDFARLAFQLRCRVVRDLQGGAAAGLYFRNPNASPTSGWIYNTVFVDADPLTADIDPGPMFLQVGPTACRTDMTGNGTTDIADIFEFLGEWFAGTNLADWDQSGLVRVEDIFEYWADWYEGC